VNPSSKQPGTLSPSKTSRAWIRGTLGIWAPSHLALRLKKPPIGAAKKLTTCDDLRRTRRRQRHRKVEVKSGSGRRRPGRPKLGSCRLTNLRNLQPSASPITHLHFYPAQYIDLPQTVAKARFSSCLRRRSLSLLQLLYRALLLVNSRYMRKIPHLLFTPQMWN
jgi:hypothetical protein